MEPQVYKTMTPPRNEETNKYLTGWARPNTAYVLFEAKKLHLSIGGARRWGTGLLILRVEDRPEQRHQVDIYLDKGARLLDYGNFPQHNDSNEKRAEKAQLYSRGGKRNPWRELEQYLRVKMGIDSEWLEKESALTGKIESQSNEIRDLHARVAMYEAKENKGKTDGVHTEGKTRGQTERAGSKGTEDKNREPSAV